MVDPRLLLQHLLPLPLVLTLVLLLLPLFDFCGSVFYLVLSLLLLLPLTLFFLLFLYLFDLLRCHRLAVIVLRDVMVKIELGGCEHLIQPPFLFILCAFGVGEGSVCGQLEDLEEYYANLEEEEAAVPVAVSCEQKLKRLHIVNDRRTA